MSPGCFIGDQLGWHGNQPTVQRSFVLSMSNQCLSTVLRWISLGKRVQKIIICSRIDHFRVVCLVTWPLNGSKAVGELVLIQTSPLLLCKSSCSNANMTN